MGDGYEEVSLEHRTQLKNLYVNLAEDVVELLYQHRVINVKDSDADVKLYM